MTTQLEQTVSCAMTGNTCNSRGTVGKGSDGSENSSDRNSTTEHKKQMMEFTLHVAGKHQTVTFDSVVEHTLEELQQDLKNGSDMAVNLRNNSDVGMPTSEPTQQRARVIKTVELEQSEAAEELLQLKLDQ